MFDKLTISVEDMANRLTIARQLGTRMPTSAPDTGASDPPCLNGVVNWALHGSSERSPRAPKMCECLCGAWSGRAQPAA